MDAAGKVVKVKRNSFAEGVLYAAAEVVRSHDETVLAADLLVAAGLQCADVSCLDEYDKEPLRRLADEQHTGGGQRIRLTGL